MDSWFLFAQNGGEIAAWFAGLGILGISLAIASVVVWIWALVDALTNPALDGTMRIVWIVVIVFTQIIGAIIYLVVARSGARSPGSRLT